MATTPELSDRDKAILDFEPKWWRYAGSKEQAIREKFDITGTRYYQILNSLIDTPAAQTYNGQLCNRLRRIRDIKQRARFAHDRASNPRPA